MSCWIVAISLLLLAHGSLSTVITESEEYAVEASASFISSLIHAPYQHHFRSELLCRTCGGDILDGGDSISPTTSTGKEPSYQLHI